MDRELGGIWDRLVADAAPCDHIVQLYQAPYFLNPTVCRFAGASLANGEGIILLPTPTADRYQSIMDMARRGAHAHFKGVQEKTAIDKQVTRFSHGLPGRYGRR